MARVRVGLSRRAERDLRKLDRTDRRRVAAALTEALASEPLPANADDKALSSRPPWRRLRVGELRILYRPAPPGRYVGRIIHRGDLDGAVRTLPNP